MSGGPKATDQVYHTTHSLTYLHIVWDIFSFDMQKTPDSRECAHLIIFEYELQDKSKYFIHLSHLLRVHSIESSLVCISLPVPRYDAHYLTVVLKYCRHLLVAA